MSVATGGIEAGDPNFYVRRGYVQIIANVRGTGLSGGYYYRYQPQESLDTFEIIEWIAGQPWCDGNVGMFGVSYFAIAAQRVVSLKPPHLKAIFAPFAVTDQWRFPQLGVLDRSQEDDHRSADLSRPAALPVCVRIPALV